MGLDECFIEVSDLLIDKYISVDYNSVNEFTDNLIEQITLATGLTVSCGVGPNKMISKMSTSINKPNGKFIFD